MKSNLSHRAWQSTAIAVLGLQCLFMVSGCQPDPTKNPPAIPDPSHTGKVTTVKKMADSIAANVGNVTHVEEGDPKRIVFIFEETHTSLAGQVEIAIMLNRLYERYGLRHIGLEGALAKKGDLNAQWFAAPFKAGDPIRPREETIVQLLANGEINNAEMMALTYSDVKVTGIEQKEEYAVESPKGAEGTAIMCLYKIATTSMSQDEIRSFNDLAQQHKEEEALKYAVNTNEFTKDAYLQLTTANKVQSVEAISSLVDKIKTKAGEANVTLSNKEMASLDGLKLFFDTAGKRSHTMFASTSAMIQQFPDAPVAMVVGAAHTEGLISQWKGAGVSFAVIRGKSLAEGRKSGDLTLVAYKRKLNARSVGPAGSLGAFLDGRKKPPPVVDLSWFRNVASINYLTTMIARAAAAGEHPPFEKTLQDVLPRLKGVTLISGSIRMVGNDVVFGVSTQDNNAQPVNIWVRARAQHPPAPQTLEPRLLEALNEVKSREEPDDSKPDPTGSKPVLMRVSVDTMAKFAKSEKAIMNANLGG
jgi:hypothetical protein